MAQEEKRIKFSASDNGVSSFMNKVRQDSQRIFTEQLSNAKKLTNETKDQIKFLREYINELQRKNKLENDARRQSIAMRMQYGGEAQQISAREDQATLRSTIAGQSAQVTVLKEMLSEMKKGVTPEKKASIFQEIIKANLISDALSALRQIPSAQTGLEGVSGAFMGAGTSTGALIGSMFKKGAIGAALGRAGLGFIGEAEIRHLIEVSRFTGAQGRLRALGLSTNVANLANLGLDYSTTANLQASIAQAAGYAPNIGAREAAIFQKGRGLDIVRYLQGLRISSTLPSVSALLSTAQARGLSDPVNFNRTLEAMTQLVQTASMTSGKVNASNIAETLFGFNRVGGQFGIQNPNSVGLITNIAQNIGNPSTPLFQAMNYSVLRRMKPGASVTSLLETMQNPLSNPEFIKNVIDDVRQRGGGEDYGVLALASRLGLQNNISAARQIYKQGFDIGGKAGDMSSFLRETESLATQNVPVLEKNQAAITNAFITGMTPGIEMVSKIFGQQISQAVKEGLKETPSLIKDAFMTGLDISQDVLKSSYEKLVPKSNQDKLWDKYKTRTVPH